MKINKLLKILCILTNKYHEEQHLNNYLYISIVIFCLHLVLLFIDICKYIFFAQHLMGSLTSRSTLLCILLQHI